jgi:high-affinity nickel permease
VRTKLTGLYFVLIAANVAGWTWALVAFQRYPMLLGAALLAYSLGLRHAVEIFVTSWIAVAVIYRVRGYDHLEFGTG